MYDIVTEDEQPFLMRSVVILNKRQCNEYKNYCCPMAT